MARAAASSRSRSAFTFASRAASSAARSRGAARGRFGAGRGAEAPPRRLRFRRSWTHFVPCLIAAPANLKVLSQPAGHMNHPNSFFSK